MKSIAAIIVLTTLCVTGALASADVNQNDKFSYDQNNYLTFEDVGRKETTENGRVIAYSNGSFVRLHVHRDGKQFDVDLVEHNPPPGWPMQILPTNVDTIQYADKDHVWIISHVHTGHRCVYYDLSARRIAAHYVGLSMTLSPDASKIAILTGYNLQSGNAQRFAVFVNGALVYPYIEPGFVFHPWGVFDPEKRITRSDGISVSDVLISKPPASGHLVPEIRWKDNDSITLHVKDDIGDTTATRYLVTGLSDMDTTHTEAVHLLRQGIDPMQKDAGEK